MIINRLKPAISAFLLTPAFSFAVVLTPNPGESNQVHWDAILGAGSFDTYAQTMRLIPAIALLIVSAWVVFGLFRAGFIACSISKVDFVTYLGRLMLLLVVSIAIIFT